MNKLFCALFLTLILTAPVLASESQQDSRYPLITYDRIDQLQLVMGLTHDDTVKDIALGPGGLLASSSYDGTVRVWDVDPDSKRFGEEVLRITVESELCQNVCYLRAVGLSENVIAVGSIYGHIWAFDADTGELLAENQSHEMNTWVNEVIIAPGEALIYTAGEDGRVMMFNLATETSVEVFAQSESINAMTDNRSGEYLLAFGGGDYLSNNPHTGIGVMFPLQDPQRVFDVPGFERPVGGLAFGPTGGTLAVVDGDESTEFPNIVIWDGSDASQPLTHVRIPANPSEGLTYGEAVTFSPNGFFLLVSMLGSRSLAFRGDELVEFNGPLDDVEHKLLDFGGDTILFNDDGNLLFVATFSETIEIYALPTDQL